MIRYWMKIFDGRKSFWYGRGFWLLFLACTAPVALQLVLVRHCAEITFWCYVVGGFNLAMAICAFSIFNAIGYLNVTSFRSESNCRILLKYCLRDRFDALQRFSEQIKESVAGGQEEAEAKAKALIRIKSFADEQTGLPVPQRVFGVFAKRMIALLAITPVYLGLGISSIHETPMEHGGAEMTGTVRRVTHSLAVVRDATTTFLAGSNTEHLDTERGKKPRRPVLGSGTTVMAASPESAAPSRHELHSSTREEWQKAAESKVPPVDRSASNAPRAAENRSQASPQAQPKATEQVADFVEGLGWELFLTAGTILYLFIILWFVPMQLGALEEAVKRFGNPEFWQNYLLHATGLSAKTAEHS